MSSQPGRSTREDELKFVKEDFAHKEQQLIIDPTDNAVQKKVSGKGASWGKAGTRAIKKVVSLPTTTSVDENQISANLRQLKLVANDNKPNRETGLRLSRQRAAGEKDNSIGLGMLTPPNIYVPLANEPPPDTLPQILEREAFAAGSLEDDSS